MPRLASALLLSLAALPAAWGHANLPTGFLGVALGAPLARQHAVARACESLAPERRRCVLSDTVTVVLVRDSVTLVSFAPAPLRPQVTAEAAWQRWRAWVERQFGPPDSVVTRRHQTGRALIAYWRSRTRPGLQATFVASEITSLAGPRAQAFTQVTVGLVCDPPSAGQGP